MSERFAVGWREAARSELAAVGGRRGGRRLPDAGKAASRRRRTTPSTSACPSTTSRPTCSRTGGASAPRSACLWNGSSCRDRCTAPRSPGWGRATPGAEPCDRETVIHDHDGLLTAAPGLGLVVSYADCVPVVVVARGADGPEFATVHAGWRGMLAGIVGQAAAALARRGRLLGAVVGPSIGPCCFTVDEELRQRFDERFPGPRRREHGGPVGLRRPRPGGRRRAAGGRHGRGPLHDERRRASSRTGATVGRRAVIWRSPGGRKRETAPEVGA